MKPISKSSEKNVLNFFSSLADETRLHILLSISEKPKTVNEIYSAVGRSKMTLSAVSHQLKQLSDLGIVTYEKKGREKSFSLSSDYCWCILRDVFKQFDSSVKVRCVKCMGGKK